MSLLAALALALGVTFAIFSTTTPSPTNTFTAGTVTLTGESQTGACSATALTPTGTNVTCTLQITYSGTIPTWMGLDVFIATKAGTGIGAENLYSPGASDNPPMFSLSSTSPTASYSLPTTALSSCPTSGPLDGVNYGSYAACYETLDLLVSTSAVTSGTVSFKTSISVPTTNGSDYQGGSAVVVIRPHVVQSANDGTTTTCTSGSVCPTIGNWS